MFWMRIPNVDFQCVSSLVQTPPLLQGKNKHVEISRKIVHSNPKVEQFCGERNISSHADLQRRHTKMNHLIWVFHNKQI